MEYVTLNNGVNMPFEKSGKNPLRMGADRDFITDIGSDLWSDMRSDI